MVTTIRRGGSPVDAATQLYQPQDYLERIIEYEFCILISIYLLTLLFPKTLTLYISLISLFTPITSLQYHPD